VKIEIRAPAETRIFKGTAAKQLLNKSDNEIDNYIDNNVTDLASAKEFLKELTKITRDTVRYVAKQTQN